MAGAISGTCEEDNLLLTCCATSPPLMPPSLDLTLLADDAVGQLMTERDRSALLIEFESSAVVPIFEFLAKSAMARGDSTEIGSSVFNL